MPKRRRNEKTEQTGFRTTRQSVPFVLALMRAYTSFNSTTDKDSLDACILKSAPSDPVTTQHSSTIATVIID